MVIGFTSSKVTPEQGRVVEEFLGGFLPRLRAEQPGVVAVYHFTKAEGGEQVTAIVCENEQARAAYRGGDLIKEPREFERGLVTTREAYPLTLALD